MSLYYRPDLNLAIVSLSNDFGQQKILWESLKPVLNKTQCGVVFDMAEVSHIDWHGVSFILDLFEKIQGSGGKLALIQVNVQVMAFLELVQTHNIIPVFKYEPSAWSDPIQSFHSIHPFRSAHREREVSYDGMAQFALLELS